MMRLRLLADDLTGALDSAAQFVPLIGRVAAVWHDRILPKSAAIDSGTRELTAAATRAAIARYAMLLDDGDPAFKKIDSLLRGHVAVELAECARRFDHCIVAPAFPLQGRITRRGRQLVRNGDDWRDTGVDLAAELRAYGVNAQLHDAETEADLDAIVAHGLALPGRVLWCGTGGLARALAGRAAVPRPHLPHPWLTLIGSDHPISAAQVAALPAHLRGDVVTCELPSGMDRNEARERIAETFASLLCRIARPGTLVVSGGATLRDLCAALDATCLEVDGEIAPGVATSILRGGEWDGQRIVSKSGAFGDVGFLARLLGGSLS